MPAKPQITREEVDALIASAGVDRAKHPCVLLGIRGYFLDSMGERAKNDRAIYDDALIWSTPHGFAAYNANTDPGAYKKGIASLKTGVWFYKKGPHPYEPPNYPAFRQAAVVTVVRDEQGEDTGNFGINIHRGGVNSVSSLGCQTVPRDQWDSFQAFGYGELTRAKQGVFPYVLINEADRREKSKGA